MAAKPIVDGIEREHADRLKVIRVNVQDPAGEILAARFAASFTPTFLLFGPQGEQRFKSVGAIDPAQVRRAIQTP